jgi:DNA-directed RNA polymerase subunit D
MNVEIIEKTETNMRLIVRDVDAPFVNALRRIVLSEVPCMAIDEVVILENSSMLQDEMLAHRLGLLPIKTDLNAYNLPEECKCKSEFGCPLCRVSLTLDAEAVEATKTIYSGSLTSENPQIVPVSPNVMLVKLAPGQRIKLEAYAKLGKGKEHAKWQPVTVCAYKNMPQIKINPKACDACGECVEVCSKKVLSVKNGKLEVLDARDCTLCQDCMDACPKEPIAIEITWDEKTFIFNVESSGVLPPDRIIQEAVKILDEKTSSFLEELTAEKGEKDEKNEKG